MNSNTFPKALYEEYKKTIIDYNVYGLMSFNERIESLRIRK